MMPVGRRLTAHLTRIPNHTSATDCASKNGPLRAFCGSVAFLEKPMTHLGILCVPLACQKTPPLWFFRDSRILSVSRDEGRAILW